MESGKDSKMEKMERGQFKFNLVKPAENMNNGLAVILYHGWGTTADSYTELARAIVQEGFTVIVPEILYHDSRNPLANCFDKKVMQTYFWKTITESIEEFEEFFQELSIMKKQTILVGSSMGGFIANGIFAMQENMGGLVNINGSGAFVFTERMFREKDGRPALALEEESFLKRFDPIQRKSNPIPVLLMHGGEDTIVPVETQEHYYRHLKGDGEKANAEFVIFPGTNHQFTAEMSERLLDWLKQYERGAKNAALE